MHSLRFLFARLLILLFWTALFALFFYGLHFTQKTPEHTLRVFAWPGILDPVYIQKFEQATGSRVIINYYESNQELLVKLKATNGEGYDLILPSDYTVNILRKENLLQPLDKKRLNFLHRLQSSLLDHYYDKGNRYSLPFDWGMYGIGIDTTQYPNGLPEASWKLVFEDPKKSLAMINDPYEAFDIAKQYLFGTRTDLAPLEKATITALLAKQHTYVTVYTDARADYLLATHNCALAVAASSYMWRGMKRYPYISFMIPKEGTILTVENFALLKTTTHTDLAYAFLNFIYSEESIEHHFNFSAFLPATTDALSWKHLPEDRMKLLVPSPEEFKKFHFLQPFLSEQDLYELWVTVKS